MSRLSSPPIHLLIRTVLSTLILGFAIAAQALSITRTSHPVLFIDTSVGEYSNYASYSISNNDASAYSNLWVKATGFSGVFTLGTSDPGQISLGTLAVGEAKPAFFYIKAAAVTNVATAHSIIIYRGRPDVGTPILTNTFTLTCLSSGGGQNNQVDSLSFTPASPQLGGLITVTVSGKTGNLKLNDPATFSPAATEAWNASKFQMVSSLVIITNSTQSGGLQKFYFTNILSTGQPGPGSSVTYSATYTMRAVASTTTNTPFSPEGYFGTGSNSLLEHSSVASGVTIPAIPPPTNSTTVAVLSSASEIYTNQPFTLTVRLSNSGPNPVYLDSIVDTLPSGFSYVAGSSAYTNGPIGNPSIASQVLTWSDGYSIPAQGSADLTFRVMSNLKASATNRVVAYSQSTVIDTTLPTTDNAPASVTIAILEQPIANADSNSTYEDNPITVSAPGVLGNDVEPNGFTLSVVSYTQPSHGSVVVGSTGGYTYTPTANYNGSDSFTYTITNQHATTATGTVDLTVNAVNDPPTLNSIGNLSITAVDGEQTVNLSGITAGPADESGQTRFVTASSSQVTIIPNPTVTYTSPGTTGSLKFTPAGTAVGTATVSVVVSDSGDTANGGINAVTNTFNVTVAPGPISASQSTCAPSLEAVTANGTSTSTITVTLKDANGNRIPNEDVTLAKSSGPGTPTIAATQGTTDASGVATFTVKSTTAGTAVFTATATTGPVALSQTASVIFTPGTPAQLAFGSQPSSTVSGAAISPAPTVLVQDANGNTVTNATSAVTMGSSTCSFTSSTLTVDAVAGVATFSSIRPVTVDAANTLSASSGALSTATSSAFSVTKTTPSITGVTSHTQSYGTTTVTLTGTVSAPGPVVPADASTVNVTINGTTRSAAVSGGAGGFSVSFPTTSIPYSTTPYQVTYSYAGDSNLNAAADHTSTTLTINRASITVTASANTKRYDRTTSAAAIPTITSGSLATGDTATWSESYRDAAMGTNLELVPSGSISDGKGGDNYSITFVNSFNGTITQRDIAVTGISTAGSSKFYDGTTAVTLSGTPALDPTDILPGDEVFLDSYNLSQAHFADYNVGGSVRIVLDSGVTLSGRDSANYSGTLSLGTAAIQGTKGSSTTTTITRTNPLDFDLTLNAGLVLADNNPADGSLNGSGTIRVNDTARLGGTGRVGAVILASGSSLTPGHSPGMLTSLTQTWNGGASYDWEINDAHGSAGADPGWDSVSISGNLDIQASAADRFIIRLFSRTVANASGEASHFDNSRAHAWRLLTVSGSILHFSQDKFSIVTTGFQNAIAPEGHPELAGSFEIAEYGKSLYVVFSPACAPTPVPDLAFIHPGSITNAVEMTFTNASGLRFAGASTMSNVSITADAYDEQDQLLAGSLPIDNLANTGLPPGTTLAIITATKVNSGQTSRVNAFVLNACAVASSSDPLLASLRIDASGAARAALDSVPVQEHFWTFINDSPGLSTLEIWVNGDLAIRESLEPGTTHTGDLATAFHATDDNSVLLIASGPPGGHADFALSDMAMTPVIPAAASPVLRVERSPGGMELRLSWEDPGGYWSLQRSTSANHGWQEDPSPVSQRGSTRTARVPLSASQGFLRLHHP